MAKTLLDKAGRFEEVLRAAACAGIVKEELAA